MADNIFITIFYSNSSGNCKALMQYLKNFNIMDKLNIKFINIDNPEIIHEVSQKFSQVPAMVVVNDEEMSLLTGENVFQWFNDHLSDSEESDQEEENSFGPEQSTSSQVDKKSILELAKEISQAREK